MLIELHFSDFDEALLLLPYSAACDILQMLPDLLKSQYQAEIVAKLTLSLLQAHHGPIVASQELLPQIEQIKSCALQQISTLRVRVIYFNFKQQITTLVSSCLFFY